MASSTRRVLHALPHKKNNKNHHTTSTHIPFLISAKLRDKLSKSDIKCKLLGDGDVSIAKLSQQFNHLCSLDFNNNLIEEYKLAIMEAVAVYLDQLKPSKLSAKAKKNTKFRKIIRWIQLGLFVFSDVVMMPSGVYYTFLGFKSMLAIVLPSIANLAVFGISIALTAIDLAIQIIFKATMIKQVLGISIGSKAKKLLTLYDRQITATEKMNTLLSLPDVFTQMTLGEYKAIAKLVVDFNQKDIKPKQIKFDDKNIIKNNKEHVAKKILRGCILAFKAIITVTGAYFWATVLLGLISASLIGTPIGWIITGVLIAAALAAFLSMRDDTMRQILSPAIKAFKQVKQKLSDFTVAKSFDHIISNTHMFKPHTHMTSQSAAKHHIHKVSETTTRTIDIQTSHPVRKAHS